MKNRIIQLILALAASAAIAAEPGKTIPLDQLFPDKVIARGNGFQVTDKEVEKAFADFKTAAAANKQTIPETQRDEIEIKLLDKIVFIKIMLQKATAKDWESGGTRAETLLNRFREQASSKGSFDRYVASLGLSMKDFKQKFIDQAVVEEVLVREVHSKISVAEDEMRRFYIENPKFFEQPETLKVAHILIVTRELQTGRELTPSEKLAKREQISRLLFRARGGEDFEGLAKQFSEDPGSKARGGVYAFARGAMAVEFETAAFALQVGRISDVVETKYGYHIIKLLDRKPPEKRSFDLAKPRIKDTLAAREAERRLPAYTAALKKEYGLQVVNAKYESIAVK